MWTWSESSGPRPNGFASSPNGKVCGSCWSCPTESPQFEVTRIALGRSSSTCCTTLSSSAPTAAISLPASKKPRRRSRSGFATRAWVFRAATWPASSSGSIRSIGLASGVGAAPAWDSPSPGTSLTRTVAESGLTPRKGRARPSRSRFHWRPSRQLQARDLLLRPTAVPRQSPKQPARRRLARRAPDPQSVASGAVLMFAVAGLVVLVLTAAGRGFAVGVALGAVLVDAVAARVVLVLTAAGGGLAGVGARGAGRGP